MTHPTSRTPYAQSLEVAATAAVMPARVALEMGLMSLRAARLPVEMSQAYWASFSGMATPPKAVKPTPAAASKPPAPVKAKAATPAKPAPQSAPKAPLPKASAVASKAPAKPVSPKPATPPAKTATPAAKPVRDASLPAAAPKPAAASPAAAPAKSLPEKTPATAPVKAAKPSAPAPTASTTANETPVAPKPVAPKVNAKPAIKPETKPVDAATSAKSTPVKPVKPSPLDAPRAGGADDLTRIKGLGPKLLRALNRMGVFHIDQIAAWTPSEVAWMDDNIQGFKGRVSRDNWVAQAKALLDEKPSG